MNSGPTPPRSDDEARDPLLTALQQRLHDYGQAPAPGAWAAIRQQLAPRPWWRRPRRLLPLLALLLGLVAVGTLTVRQGRSRFGNLAAGRAEPKTQGTLHKRLTTAALVQQATRQEATDAVGSSASTVTPYSSITPEPSFHTATTPAATPITTTVASPTTTTALTPRSTQAATLAQRRPAGIAHSSKAATSSSKSNPTTSVATRPRVALAAHTNPAASSHYSAVRATRLTSSGKHPSTTKQLLNNQFASRTRRARYRAASRAQRSALGSSSPSEQPLAVASSSNSRHLRSPRSAKATATPPRTQRSLAHVLSLAGRQRGVAVAPRVAQARQAQTEAAFAAEELAGLNNQPAAADSLALQPVALGLLPDLALPPLVAQPDSAKPGPRARRWSVLVLAGPTLSYRTLGVAPALAARHPDFARLERPALGFGAQVQVRRVLSGRWALAAGLGYHEYATRLALSVIDSSNRSPRSVHQRDVYRVLTLPVQFSYALGAPRGRLAWALLAGAEPSWYRGGRSTEGSDCGCQQQSYPLDSAKTSPYRPLSLAVSLGLDLRYRLGGPASHWQWVVQPTARYIVTPFVRSEAVGFTRRQPWSLGLLTGISWDFR